ncbi:hypothetical protein ACFLVO_00855 [Chloroflexota bacterium]
MVVQRGDKGMRIISEASKEVLKNSHATLKWMWIIVMGFAVKKAIETFIYYIEPSTGAEVLRDWQHFYLKDVMLFIIFILTMVRFYHGDSRYLDRTYLESQLRTFNPKTYSARNRFCDFCLLLIHAILFYSLAAHQRNFPIFFCIYGSLLLFNAVWLGIMSLRALRKEDVKYPLNWAINNVIHVCFFIALYLCTNKLEASYSYIIFFALAISNSLFDYLTTWPYYFPKIVEANQKPPIKNRAQI